MHGYYSAMNTRFVFIDGNANNTLEKCFATLHAQLSIPSYFGFNLDALEEVMNDLEWIDEEKITIIIANQTSLLQNEATKKADFLQILEQTEIENVEIVYLGAENDAF